MNGATTLIDPVAAALFLSLAFVLAGIPHALWLRSARSLRFAQPIDVGRTLRGHRWFGDHKTWRGLMVLVPAAGAAFLLLFPFRDALPTPTGGGLWNLSPAQYGALGLWAGLGFMLGELPNSFLKRQLAIPPGECPAGGGWRRGACFVVDHVDSILGMLLFVHLFAPVPAWTWGTLLLAGPAVHLAFSALLCRLGVKARFA